MNKVMQLKLNYCVYDLIKDQNLKEFNQLFNRGREHIYTRVFKPFGQS